MLQGCFCLKIDFTVTGESKVETIGDAYMFVSGLPLVNGFLHAGEVGGAALELLQSISVSVWHCLFEISNKMLGLPCASSANRETATPYWNSHRCANEKFCIRKRYTSVLYLRCTSIGFPIVCFIKMK